MLWEIQPPKWHSVCGRCTGFTELSENDDVSFPDCCCLYRYFFLFVGSSVDASILQGVARSGHLLQRCGCIIDGGFFRLMLEGQENKKAPCVLRRDDQKNQQAVQNMSLGANGGFQCGAEIWNCLQQGTSLHIRAGGTQVVFHGDLHEAEVKDVPCSRCMKGPESFGCRASICSFQGLS